MTDGDTDIRGVIWDFGLATASQNSYASTLTTPIILRGYSIFQDLFWWKKLNKINNFFSGLSPQYASPELFEAVQNRTDLHLKDQQKADVFAFGVIAWEMLTKQIPWAGTDNLNIHVALV